MADIKNSGEALNGRVPSSLKICFKLAELENHWQEVVGKAAAERSSPVSCEFSEEGLIILIHVDSPGVLPALQSRKPIILRSVSRYLGVRVVKLDIKVGMVRKQSSAKEPLPEYLRRPPVLISESSLQKNIKDISRNVSDEELAEELAKLKTVIERRNLRKK
ncbi:MAG: DciA family protein [Synergistaceae bacterium]|nr:DciA family protein [Synergistaceae bacterium]